MSRWHSVCSHGVAAMAAVLLSWPLFAAEPPATEPQQAPAAQPSAALPPVYQPVACDLPVVSEALAARLQCGVLRVKSPDGRPFQLAVVRKVAAQPQPGAAPVLFLAGGPGAALTWLAGQSEQDFVEGHDWIAVDLRGSGRSAPQFCPQLSAQLQQALLHSADDNSLQQQRRTALLQCQQQMAAQGYSSKDFGAVQSVQDLELLREQLNIEQWHLYAQSYGTVVALQYLAVAPAGISSVTLDSVYPPDELLTSFKLQQDQWLRQLDAVCQQQAGCVQRFGSMPELFKKALARVSQQPLALGTSALQLTPDKLRLAVMQAGMSAQTLSLLPLWLEAVSQGNNALLQALPDKLLSASADVLTAGATQPAAALAAECADRKRLYQQHRADGLEQLFGWPEGVCHSFGTDPEQMQVPQVPETAKVRKPVLILSGGLDVFQPDSEVLAQWLGPHSQLVTVPGALHGVHSDAPCARDIVTDFIRAPQRFGPPSCLSALKAPYLVKAVEINPPVAALALSLRQGQLALPLSLLCVALGLSIALGLAWPLLASIGYWLSGKSWQPRVAAQVSGLSLLATTGAWGGLAWSLWQGLERHSAELWLGLPPESQPWRLAIAGLSLPALALLWGLARSGCWRQLLAQFAMLSASLLALANHILP